MANPSSTIASRKTRHPVPPAVPGTAWARPLCTAVSFAAALASAGCVTTPAPADQIKYFSQAFSALDTLGQPLLDDLAVAERTRGKRLAIVRAKGKLNDNNAPDCIKDNAPWFPDGKDKGIIRGFCLSDAGYFSTLGDPPETAAMRGGLDVIRRYADILSTLADGRNIDGAIGDLNMLAQNVTSLAGVAGVAEPLGAALSALHPILVNAAKQANGVEARRLILEGAPKVTTLIKSLRASAPALFKTLIETSSEHLTSTAVAATPALADADISKVEAYRLTVANYVALLGKLELSWELTVAAANAPPGSPRLSGLVEQTTELKADADSARKALAVFRATPQTN